MQEYIKIRGAREHNLRGVNLDLPKNALIVFTGVSGSGKSSLAFDTLFAEGQRRYVESLSAYARQFLAQLPRPKVRRLEGLAPALAVSQAARSNNPRSTVATITEIYDHLRVLYAGIGVPHCPRCGQRIGAQTREAIIARILDMARGTTVTILAPLERGRRGEYMDLFTDLRRKGFARVRVDGEIHELINPPQLDRRRRHDVDLVVDRVKIGPEARARVAEAVDVALAMSGGDVIAATDREEIFLSRRFACHQCGISLPEPTHASFSFNSPRGMCPECEGLGQTRVFDPDRLVEHPERSILDGAIPLLPSLRDRRRRHWFEGAARHYGFDLRTPWKDLKPEHQHVLLYGSGDEEIEFYFRHWKGWEWRHRGRFEGVINWLTWRYKQARSDALRAWYEAYMNFGVCPACRGRRLRPESLAVTIAGKSIADVVAMSVAEAREWFSSLRLSPVEEKIAEDALKEIRERLEFLVRVGLGYLTLDRTAPTLAGGEAQRLRLASQVGSGLSECLYVLDEPSIGLHPRDQGMLLDTLRALRDRDNTVIVVEHDEQTILAADWIVDFGPGAGHRGGRVVVQGTPADIRRADTLTGRYLSHRERIPIPKTRRKPDGRWLTLRGARQNNLQNIDVRFPVGLFTCVTGVSGSGKSSLVADTLYPALARALHRAELEPGAHDALEGLEYVDKVVLVDQDPIGRTPRSNPATYVGVFDHIRAFYASLPESRARGFRPGRFSFNTPEGRCSACQGYGARRIESDFLADVWVPCEECGSSRYARETLSVTYRGKNIADVLDMEIAEAVEFFAHLPRIRQMLEVMRDVGLGYVKLGQPAPTLSGGEAQRVKLAAELARPRTGHGVYILDEPTTGLHLDDVRQLLEVLQRFVEEGNTVLVVEHHPDVIKSADWIIDLGPEGGAEGGRIVAEGPPEVVAQNAASHTGRLLRRVLAGLPAAPPGGHRRRLDRPARTDFIEVHGAREHNLKNLHVRLPRRKLTVFSGVSGSGKTSLALDTLYAEGQRRFVESLSPYARQFVSQMPKPKVDRISGLPPAVALDQRGIPWNPRATVGTMTQVYDYLRVLFARVATPFCPKCGVEITTQTTDRVVDRLLAELGGEQVILLGPLRLADQEDYPEAFARLARLGWTRVRIDGEVVRLDQAPSISRRRHHRVEVVVDRVAVEPGRRPRLAEAVEAATKLSGGEVVAVPLDGNGELRASLIYGCRQCGRAYEPLTPKHYSFNHPEGWCPTCLGLGVKVARGLEWIAELEEPAELVDLTTDEKPCPACAGGRIRPEAAAARLAGRTIVDLCLSPLDSLREFFRQLSLSPAQRAVTSEVLGEIESRLDFLLDVGLDYLTLHRPGPTLSGGEAQRVRLAGQLGGNLTGLLYVMDEPTIGTHPRDVDRMLRVLRRLRDTGNTLLVVEHDPQTLRSADHVVDFGPGAGPQGGRIVAKGSPDQLARSRTSLTGKFIAGSLSVPVPENRRITPAGGPDGKFAFPAGCLVLEGCAQHNLRDITVSFPLNTLICVTGPSGSGKSTLVSDILYSALARKLGLSAPAPGKHRAITGWQGLRGVALLDQSPIGQSPRSNPATYVGIFDEIRRFFARLPEARMRGFTPEHFSFNRPGGRCEECEGMGARIVQMHFLPDVWVTCEACGGRRYKPEILAVRYRGRNIADVLEMSIGEAAELFAAHPRLAAMLGLLCDMGLDYLPLGQSAPTLSGGEAQRLKIARELLSARPRDTLYILDEPTTGLHPADLIKLLKILNRLVDYGNTVVVIEHNMDFVKAADWVIDLGPGGGDKGGRLMAQGPPETVAQTKASPTGPYLRRALASSQRVPRAELTLPERPRPGRVVVEELAKAPWESDPQGWHLGQRIHEGQTVHWSPDALRLLDEAITALGARAEWTNRTHIYYYRPQERDWWAYVRTAGRICLELVVRVPKGSFDEEALCQRLRLRAFRDLPSPPTFSDTPRVRVQASPRDYDRLVIRLLSPEDIGAALREVLAQAWMVAGAD